MSGEEIKDINTTHDKIDGDWNSSADQERRDTLERKPREARDTWPGARGQQKS
jgi:hypothetical protein